MGKWGSPGCTVMGNVLIRAPYTIPATILMLYSLVGRLSGVRWNCDLWTWSGEWWQLSGRMSGAACPRRLHTILESSYHEGDWWQLETKGESGNIVVLLMVTFLVLFLWILQREFRHPIFCEFFQLSHNYTSTKIEVFFFLMIHETAE